MALRLPGQSVGLNVTADVSLSQVARQLSSAGFTAHRERQPFSSPGLQVDGCEQSTVKDTWCAVAPHMS